MPVEEVPKDSVGDPDDEKFEVEPEDEAAEREIREYYHGLLQTGHPAGTKDDDEDEDEDEVMK